MTVNFNVTIDWKFVVAAGAAISGVVLTEKLSPEAAERVSVKAIDACRELASEEEC